MKGRDILKGLTEAQTGSSKKSVAPPQRTSGSVRALKSELDKITEEAASAKSLRESIAKEGRIIELDPNLVEGAVISDRIPMSNDDQFEALKAAIKEVGQQVPILVRSHPEHEERYQAAYGHRRLRATRELGINIKAIVHELTDEQMVLAQGQENGPRLDLSFIERAFYASKLLAGSYDRDLVCSALGVDKPEVSRLLKVAEAIGSDLMMAIGPARKIGRPRWLALAQALENEKAAQSAKAILSEAIFSQIDDSNARFDYVLKACTAENKKPQKKASEAKNVFKSSDGKKMGWHQNTSKGVLLSVENQAFSAYLMSKLPELLEGYIHKKQEDK